jgi:hypothetical protein
MNLTCFWGGKSCAKWTNQIVEQPFCNDPMIGHLGGKFCADNGLQWIALTTPLIRTNRRKIWQGIIYTFCARENIYYFIVLLISNQSFI